MLEILLAAALIAGDAPATPAEIHVLRPQLLTLGVVAEIIDPREVKWMLAAAPVDDLETLRSRWRTLEAAPHVADIDFFPDAKIVAEHQHLNRACRTWFTDLVAVNGLWREEVAAAVARLDYEYEAWDCVRDARQDAYWVTTRREALAHLQDLIGDQRYFSGRLP